nr:hypothetical protein [Tanacetum cinerariifolium]
RNRVKESQETINVSEEPVPAKKKNASRRVVKKKVTMSADDNIISDDPDAALELAKSISQIKAKEAEVARKVHATHARIVTEFVSEYDKKKSSVRSSKSVDFADADVSSLLDIPIQHKTPQTQSLSVKNIPVSVILETTNLPPIPEIVTETLVSTAKSYQSSIVPCTHGSIDKDENAIDKGVADTFKDHKRKHDDDEDDDDEDPPAGPNQEPKSRKTLNLEWFKQPLRPPTPDLEWNKQADLPVLDPLVGALPFGVSLVVDGFFKDSNYLVLLLLVFLPWFGPAGGSSSSSSSSSSCFRLWSLNVVRFLDHSSRAALSVDLMVNYGFFCFSACSFLILRISEGLFSYSCPAVGVGFLEPVEEPIAEEKMDEAGDDVVRDDDQPQADSKPNNSKTLNP